MVSGVGSSIMNRQQIVMNFSLPPGVDDIEVIARECLAALPEELSGLCEELVIRVEELADSALETEMELDDPFELIALYRSGGHVSPGVEKKVANDDDILLIFRRPLLDMWCETGEDLNALVRQVMIEELAQNFEFSDDEIDEMTRRHYQGML